MGYFNSFSTIDYDINGDGVFDNILNLSSSVKISSTLINNATFYDLININDGERPEQLSYRLYGSTEYYWTFLLINDNINNIWNDWPKSSNQLVEYCEHKYDGIACITNDSFFSLNVSTGLSSLKFEIGETVLGTSGASGIIKEIHSNNHYLVLTDVVGTFNAGGETVRGLSSEDSIVCSSIMSKAYAPKYHIDASTGVITAKRAAGTHPFTYYNFEDMMNDKNRSIKVIKPSLIHDVAAEFNSQIST